MPTISEHDALPAGARLGEFEIQQVLGTGGFGVVYLALDHALERQVAIKEYMPASLASRGEGLQVVVRSAAHAQTYALGLRSFINEARLLARFDHPSLVKVYRFWEAHGTAYMVMPHYRGVTLQQVRRDMSSPPDEAWLRRLINPLLGALECLHRENVYHRDVAPDNILLLDNEAGPGMGPPVLLDLGAARRVIGDHTQALTAIVKPSFAPIEQYAETVQLRQGPWTDLYALAAVVHFCITGRPPMPATVRAVHDELPSLWQMRPGLASTFDRQFSEPFMLAMDHALAVRPQDRPESVAAWREELSGIVGEQGSASQDKGPAWSAQTVLVHNGSAERPAGHQAAEAMAFMTTIPAAGRLHAQPAWAGDPARRHQPGVSGDAVLPEPSMPVTIPLRGPDEVPQVAPVPQAAAVAGRADAPARGADVPSPPHAWVRWLFVGMALTAAMAVWWSTQQRRAAEGPGADQISEQAPGQPPTAQREGGNGRASKQAGAPAGTSSATQAAKSQARAGHPKAGRPGDAEEQAAQAEADGADKGNGEALNPRKACSGKNFILLAICMKRHCVRPEYAAHPECERMRQQEAAQQRGNYP